MTPQRSNEVFVSWCNQSATRLKSNLVLFHLFYQQKRIFDIFVADKLFSAVCSCALAVERQKREIGIVQEQVDKIQIKGRSKNTSSVGVWGATKSENTACFLKNTKNSPFGLQKLNLQHTAQYMVCYLYIKCCNKI